MSADPHLEDRHRALALLVRETGERNLRAVARDDEDPRRRAAEIAALLAEADLLRHAVPPPAGTADARSVLVVREGLAYFSLLAESVFAAQALSAHPVAAAGTEAQRGRWLPALASARVTGALAATEPEAGTDLGAVRTEAARDGSLYRLTGTKTWVTAAKGAGLFVVLARASAEDGPKGLALFLVDGGAPGLATRPIEATAAVPACEVRLDAVPAVLLGEAGAGLRLVKEAFLALRPGAAGAACGLAARAFDEAVRHSMTRRQHGRPLAGFQAVKMALADVHAELEAARRLARHAAWLLDTGAKDGPREAAAARLVAAETAGRVVDRALQLHGARGLVRGSTVERLYREARALRLREGTSEGLRLELAEAILKENR